jgi:hypothetical protein
MGTVQVGLSGAKSFSVVIMMIRTQVLTSVSSSI